jgi:tRNA nucleotidyltransferase (CCA-adding enzyme)
VTEDILYSQIRRCVRFLERQLCDADFSLISTGFFVDSKTTLVFELKSLLIPGAKLHVGPWVNSENEVAFLRKHRGKKRSLTNPFIKDDRWCVFLLREHQQADRFLESFFSKKDLKKKGIPSHLARVIQKQFMIKKNEDALNHNPDFFGNFFDPLFPWEADHVQES